MRKMTFGGVVVTLAITIAAVLGLYVGVRLADLAFRQMQYRNCLAQLEAVQANRIEATYNGPYGPEHASQYAGLAPSAGKAYDTLYADCDLCRRQVRLWRLFQ